MKFPQNSNVFILEDPKTSEFRSYLGKSSYPAPETQEGSQDEHRCASPGEMYEENMMN